MNFAFLMDPLHTVKMEKDTTFILMLAAHRRGYKVYFVPDGGITVSQGRVHVHAVRVIPQQVKEKPFIDQENKILSGDEIDCFFIRTDPPFDYGYLTNTWLLEHLPPTVPVINNPGGVRTVNEKIWAAQFSGIIPPTLIARNQRDLLNFLSEHQNTVVKPTDGFGGQSVFHVKKGEANTNVILETVTNNFKRDVIMQKFIAEAANGDKRILLLDGEPLGAVLRMHAEDDHRNNFFSGGKPMPAEITDREKEIIAVLKTPLKSLGLYFVGIDILGDYLVEVNVTSPTCLQEMSGFLGERLENRVIDFAETLIQKFKIKK